MVMKLKNKKNKYQRNYHTWGLLINLKSFLLQSSCSQKYQMNAWIESCGSNANS